MPEHGDSTAERSRSRLVAEVSTAHGDTAEGRFAAEVGAAARDALAERVRAAADGLRVLLAEAAEARTARAEASGTDGATAVCAWNHFENIPTFYNWNNRPR